MDSDIRTVENDIEISSSAETGKTRREAITAFVAVAIVGAATCLGCGHPASDGQTAVGGGTPAAAGNVPLGSIAQLKASKTPSPVMVNGKQAFVDFSGGAPEVISAICPHKGCAVAFNAGSNQFVCPCHNSIFARNGTLVSGVAQAPLAIIKSHVSGDTLYADS